MADQSSSINAVEGQPPIVYISDIHGYIHDTRSALTTLSNTDEYDPVVTQDESGTLHWADNDYVLVFNGDVIDRGPANDACLELVWRLIEEAPSGRVHYHLGNHELAIILPVLVNWPDTYSTDLSTDQRRAFLQHIIDGDVTIAYKGHTNIISHAGSNKAFDPAEVNDSLRVAASMIVEAIGDRNEIQVQKRVANRYDRLFQLGEHGGRGPSAGLCWLDFGYLDPSAPNQLVGHTKRFEPVRKGNVICGNVIRMNQGSPSGEGILIETPEAVKFVKRQAGGSVAVKEI